MRNVKGKNTYCGPAAISIITGLTTDQSARVIREVSGSKSVRGVYDWQMREALCNLGYTVNFFPILPGDRLKHLNDGRTWVVAWRKGKTLHYGVIRGNRYADNFTRGPVKFDNPHVNENAKIVRAFAVSGSLQKPAYLSAKKTPLASVRAIAEPLNLAVEYCRYERAYHLWSEDGILDEYFTDLADVLARIEEFRDE